MTITDALRGYRCYIAGDAATEYLPNRLLLLLLLLLLVPLQYLAHLATRSLARSHSHLWPNCNALLPRLRPPPASDLALVVQLCASVEMAEGQSSSRTMFQYQEQKNNNKKEEEKCPSRFSRQRWFRRDAGARGVRRGRGRTRPPPKVAVSGNRLFGRHFFTSSTFTCTNPSRGGWHRRQGGRAEQERGEEQRPRCGCLRPARQGYRMDRAEVFSILSTTPIPERSPGPARKSTFLR